MSGLKLFYFVMFGQALSLLGTTLTNFGLGVWAYELGGNVSDFTYIAIASTLPGIVLGPFIGTLIDRWNRKWTLFFAQLGSSIATLILAVLFWLDQLQMWHILMVVPFASVCVTVLQVGFTSTIALVVPKDSLNRANASLSLAFGSIQLSGPLLAGVAIDQIGLKGVFLIDIFTFVIGMFTLLVANIPSPERRKIGEKFKLTHLWHDLVDAYRYMQSKPGVLGGLFLFTLIWFNVSIVQVLFVPMVLSLGTKTDLGFVQSMGGVGTLVGGILMVIWKGPERKMFAILGASAMISLGLVVVPMTTSVSLLAAGAFCVMIMAPAANTSSQTLWQKKTDPSYQGRVFSLRNTMMKAAQPLAFFVAGFLADNYFEPYMLEGELLASYFGPYWGMGEGRGVAFLISLVGAVTFVFVMITWCIRSVRRADIDVPDFDEEDEKTLQNKHLDKA